MDERALKTHGHKTAQDWGGDEQGLSVADWFEDGIRVIIKVIRKSHYSVYLGIPASHPVAGLDYDNISFIDAHGGLTYANEGDDKYLPGSLYWYGYDYAHCGDYCGYKIVDDDKAWKLREVAKEVWTSVYELKQLMSVAEKIINRKYELREVPGEAPNKEETTP